MRLLEKLSGFIEGKKAQLKRGVEVTKQIQAEKQRKQLLESAYREPGTIRYGLNNKQNPLDFMHDVYDKRKMDRELKSDKK